MAPRNVYAVNERLAGHDTELTNLVREVKQLRAEVASVKKTLQILIDADKRTGEYMEWLRQRAAAREKK